MIVAGHDHLFDHLVERYTDSGVHAIAWTASSPAAAARRSTPTSASPTCAAYVAASAAQSVRVEHLVKPGATPDDNPHHFVVVQVDGDRLSLEVVGTGATDITPYNGSAKIALSDRRVSDRRARARSREQTALADAQRSR